VKGLIGVNTGDLNVLRMHIRPVLTSDLLLSPIALLAFQWEEWQSQYLG